MNNEAYQKLWSDSQIRSYLDKLLEVHTTASAASLSTHYSVGWHWGREHGSSAERLVTWNGRTANASEHMVRTFDSVDVQVKKKHERFVIRAGAISIQSTSSKNCHL